MLTDLEQGDISETIKKYFGKTDYFTKRSTVTLKQVDDFLDNLTTVGKVKDQTKLLSQFTINKLTLLDLKYLIRLIIGDLKSYAGAKNILLALHEDAYEIFKLSNDLKTLVERIKKGEDLKSLNSPSNKIDSSFNFEDYKEVIGSDIDSEEDFQKKGVKKKENKIKAFIKLNTPIKPMLARASKYFKLI
jgi:hypothetical protein